MTSTAHKRTTTPEGPPGAFSIEDAADWLGISKWSVYDACGAGQMRYYRHGRRILIPYRELLAYQDRRVETTMQKEHNIRELRR